jgi:uncharacterized membrane protein YesL
LLFALSNLPAIFAVLIVSQAFLQANISNDSMLDMMLKSIFGAFLLCIPVVTFGPAQAGFTYVLRNFAREEHAFIWSDFKEHALKNLKQSLIVSLIDFLVVVLIGLDINFYLTVGKSGILSTVATAIMVVAFVFYLMMHMYIYPMMVTFELGLKNLYKNALIFTLMRFLPNLAILLICLAVIFLTFYNFLIGLILLPVITFSIIGFITNFHVYPTIKKYMLDKVQGQETSNIQQ